MSSNSSGLQPSGRGSGPYSRPDFDRVVITGMSAVTPVGNSVDETWEGLINGRSGAGPITVLDPTGCPCTIDAEFKNFDTKQFIPIKEARHMTKSTQLAVIVAGQAMEDADLDLARSDRDRIGVVVGTMGINADGDEIRAPLQQGNGKPGRISPIQLMKLFPNMPSFFVSKTHNLRGYNLTVCTACASGAQAISEAAHVIRRGEAEVMIAGGTEFSVSRKVLDGFASMRALATNFNDDPTRAMRPFDADREGFIPGFGSAFVVLERLDYARARGVHIYAEVLGASASNDAFHMIAPDRSGSGAALAMSRALANAGIEPSAVDYINAHGTSTPQGDVAETKAIKAIFGESAYDIPVSSTKSMVGHMMGAAGAVEAVVCIKTIQEGVIHPTINYETSDPDCDLDYVPNVAREVQVNIAVSNSLGLGGQNACLILGSV